MPSDLRRTLVALLVLAGMAGSALLAADGLLHAHEAAAETDIALHLGIVPAAERTAVEAQHGHAHADTPTALTPARLEPELDLPAILPARPPVPDDPRHIASMPVMSDERARPRAGPAARPRAPPLG
jgi:hypothetical protein